MAEYVEGKNVGNVKGGFKATINNPNISDETKQRAQEKLDALEDGDASVVNAEGGGEPGTNNVIGGYKATISNPNTSKKAKQHARDVLDGKDNAASDFVSKVPEE